ncbi:MAG: YihY family inner membrane protein [Zetaproteobacteria bacterium]|nr:MAG: YihY family inner membrane protein [Zetaproteobacteria bacterium]
MDIAELASLPSLARYTAHLLRFCLRVLRRFVADQCIQRASALAYATLLAIVPLAALGFSMFASFQVFEHMADHIRGIMLEYLLPTSQQAVEQYLGSIADKTTTLSVFGIIGLLLTATALLNTMEEAFNNIWRITRARPWLSKFIIFWSTLTLAPILIAASITVTSYFAALPVLEHVAQGANALKHIPFVLPWLMSSLAMSLMYTVLPNTTVPLRHALVGGLVAGALFEGSKLAFTFYVTDVANYEKIYGALSTLPIFLIWLYLSWVIVLLGSEIVFCLQHPEQSTRARNSYAVPGVKQFFAHLILLRAAAAQATGNSLSISSLIEETGVPDNLLQEWLDELVRCGLLFATHDNHWVLAGDARRLTLDKIHAALNQASLTIPKAWQEHTLGQVLRGIYFRLQREQSLTLGQLSLYDLLRKEGRQSGTKEEHDD